MTVKSFYSKEVLEVLRANTFLSPHTARILNNPIHAYICDGRCNFPCEGPNCPHCTEKPAPEGK
jgi:hypothetical protein